MCCMDIASTSCLGAFFAPLDTIWVRFGQPISVYGLSSNSWYKSTAIFNSFITNISLENPFQESIHCQELGPLLFQYWKLNYQLDWDPVPHTLRVCNEGPVLPKTAPILGNSHLYFQGLRDHPLYTRTVALNATQKLCDRIFQELSAVIHKLRFARIKLLLITNLFSKMTSVSSWAFHFCNSHSWELGLSKYSFTAALDKTCWLLFLLIRGSFSFSVSSSEKHDLSTHSLP